ncbi:MAG TPA: bifunctional glutamate N-acetyltransferase/amino-acid acetyltransferase ArgJ [Tepidisphaeraceae bacterium]|nr:bifunctional glutamate N-acetyltransferase/amino-acid acetyltransferase ArgJ [Tepidisphaeraceae bacterium]
MSHPHLLSPAGFRASAVYAGIKSKPTADVALLVCETAATAAAAFTTNKVAAAPIKIGKLHIRRGRLRGVVVNAGNANACTGKQGEKDALRMCQVAAGVVGCQSQEILPSSTGIIGHLLPMEKLESGIRSAGQYLGDSLEHANLFADAILTTDLKRKTASTTMRVGRQTVTLSGVCKGSGMIGPRLAVPHATMLAYLTTDAAISAAALRKILASTVEESFNAVTVDDHTSTNDTVCVLASGAGAKIDSPKSLRQFAAAMNEVCRSLSWQIAADGEGATKVVRIEVCNAANNAAAKAMARAIANSPLVKCAMNGNDPNWGRIVSAAGLAGVPFEPDRCVLKLQETLVFRAGRPAPFDAAQLSDALKRPEVIVDLDCRMGKSHATVWTCDLSKEYVTINADYHT